jgi:2-methylisocitrate lyase-like PEP mutase family enzyme
MLFVEAPNGEQLPKIGARFKGVPLLYNMATSGKTPFLGKAEIERLGFKLIIYPNWLMLAAIKAASQVLETLKKEGTIAGLAPQVPSFREFFDLVGMDEVQEIEARYGVEEAARAKY